MSRIATCPSCGTTLEPGDQWCTECGTQVQLDAASVRAIADTKNCCPGCAETVEASDEWCVSCGTRLRNTEEESISLPSTESAVPLLQPLGSTAVASILPPDSPRLDTPTTTPITPSTTAVDKTARRGWNSILGCHTCESCFAQDVKDAPTCYQCGARFLTPEEISAIEVEAAKTDLERARERTRVALTETAAKVSSAGRETLRSAAETRAGKSLKNYSVGWMLVAVTLIVGFVGLGMIVSTGRRKPATNLIVSPANTTPAPQASTPQVIRQTDNRWNRPYDLNADARRRAEAQSWSTNTRPFGSESQAPVSSGLPMNAPPLGTGSDLAAMQRQQEQQMRDMEARNQQFQEQQEQRLQQLQKQAEANQMVKWQCTYCHAVRYLPKSANEPSEETGKGTCIDEYGHVLPGHSWAYEGPAR